MSILFTTGATVTFHALLDHVISPDFFEFLQKSGFSSISIQYGNEIDSRGNNASKKYVSERMAATDLVGELNLDIQNSTNDKSLFTLANDSLKVQLFSFSPEISTFISDADLVVSHAGTGSILDTLRLKKPLVVVTNDSLMDNHQDDVASQFEADGYVAKVAGGQLGQGLLEAAIEKVKNGTIELKDFPEAGSVLEQVVAEESHKA